MLLVAAAVGVALMPWNVALWWQFLRLRSTVETDCDARVLARGTTNVRQYGEILLRVASQTARIPALCPAMGRKVSLIEQRLVAMTSGPTRYPRLQMTAMASVACMAMIAAADASVPVFQPTVSIRDLSFAQLQFKVNHMTFTFDGSELSNRAYYNLQPQGHANVGTLHLPVRMLSLLQSSGKGTIKIMGLKVNGHVISGPMIIPIQYQASGQVVSQTSH
jgi:hypothetical protein